MGLQSGSKVWGPKGTRVAEVGDAGRGWECERPLLRLVSHAYLQERGIASTTNLHGVNFASLATSTGTTDPAYRMFLRTPSLYG